VLDWYVAPGPHRAQRGAAADIDPRAHGCDHVRACADADADAPTDAHRMSALVLRRLFAVSVRSLSPKLASVNKAKSKDSYGYDNIEDDM